MAGFRPDRIYRTGVIESFDRRFGFEDDLKQSFNMIVGATAQPPRKPVAPQKPIAPQKPAACKPCVCQAKPAPVVTKPVVKQPTPGGIKLPQPALPAAPKTSFISSLLDKVRIPSPVKPAAPKAPTAQVSLPNAIKRPEAAAPRSINVRDHRGR